MEICVGDVAIEAASGGGVLQRFADDPNQFQNDALRMASVIIFAEMSQTRKNVHKWRKQHRVISDADKDVFFANTNMGKG